MYYRGEYAQCKLCKSRRFHSAVLGQVVHAPVVLLRQVLGVGQCRKTVEVPQLQSVQFLEVIDTPVVLVTTGACVGQTVQNSSRFCSSGQGCWFAVGVQKLWRLRSYSELWFFWGALYKGTRLGVVSTGTRPP